MGKIELIDKDYLNALGTVVESGQVSIAFIQRECGVGFYKADEIVKWMEKRKYVSKDKGKPRKVRLKAKKLQKLYGVDVVSVKESAPIPVEENVAEVEPLYIDCLKFAIEKEQISISFLQRNFKIGYNKAGQIIDWMEKEGYVSAFDGAKARKVLITAEDFEKKFGKL